MLEKLMNFVVRYDLHKYSPNIGLNMILIMSVLWAGNFVRDLEYWSPLWIGIPLWFIIQLTLWLSFFFCDFLFMHLAIKKPVRSGIWLSAVTGSTVAIAALSNLEDVVTHYEIWSQFLGVACASLAFFIGYLIDRTSKKSPNEAQLNEDLS